MFNLTNDYKKYRKALAAFIAGLAGFLAVAYPLISDGRVSVSDIIAISGAFAAWLGSAGAVYSIPNDKNLG